MKDVKQEEVDEEESRGSARVSDAAAKLFADIAADILEDEDEEQLLQEAQQPAPATISVDTSIGSSPSVSQLVMDNGTGQMLITTQPRQVCLNILFPFSYKSNYFIFIHFFLILLFIIKILLTYQIKIDPTKLFKFF